MALRRLLTTPPFGVSPADDGGIRLEDPKTGQIWLLTNQQTRDFARLISHLRKIAEKTMVEKERSLKLGSYGTRTCMGCCDLRGETAHFSSCKIPRQELVQPIDRVLCDACEYVAQIRLGLQAVELGCPYDGVERRRPSATRIRTSKKPILSTYSNAAEGILHGIVADLQPAVIDVARQSDPARARIADRLGQLAASGNTLELLIEPSGQLFQSRFGQLRAYLLAHVRGLVRDWALDVEEYADPLEALFGNRRTVRVVYIEEEASRVAPTSDLGDRTRFGVLFPMVQLTKS